MHSHTDRASRPRTRLGLESLEGRTLLSAAPPVPAHPLLPQDSHPAVIRDGHTPASAPSPGAAAGQAGANLVAFSSHWSVSPGPVLTGTNHVTGRGRSTGCVAVALARAGADASRLGGAQTAISAPVLTTSSSAPDSSPDLYHESFGLRLMLKDEASGATGQLTFDATLNGTITATRSALTATIQGPLTRQLTLGGHVYTVTFKSGAVLLPPPGNGPVALGVVVQVNPVAHQRA
jgi:hypothetical protein